MVLSCGPNNSNAHGEEVEMACQGGELCESIAAEDSCGPMRTVTTDEGAHEGGEGHGTTSVNNQFMSCKGDVSTNGTPCAEIALEQDCAPPCNWE